MSKEHAYAYEAGYRDGSINYELEHCPACKNVADLQEVLEENAKLRELVRDVWHLFTEHGSVHPRDMPVVDAVRERMNELEVEVDG